MGLPTPFNPYTPIPNLPFISPQFEFLNSSIGPLILGSGLNVSLTGNPQTLSTSGGGGGGAVSQIIAGTGITVSPSGGTGNVIVNNAGVLSIAAGAGISVSAASGNYTISATGGSGTVTSVATGSGLLGGPITTTGTLTLDYTCVVDPTEYSAKGVILGGTGVSSYAALPVGANGLVLTACSAASTGLCWASPSTNDIPCAAITGKGALITGTGPATTFSLGVGSNGQVLTACSACGPGLFWSTPTAIVPSATPSVEGIVYGVTDAATTFNVGLGSGVLSGPTTGVGNVALGTQAGYGLTTGQQNNLVGAGAGCALTSGLANNLVGFLSGSALTTGCRNIIIGDSAGTAYTTENGNVLIGGNFGIAGQECQIILSDGFGNLQFQINECGAISPDGADYGTAGQVLCSNGATGQWGWVSTTTSEATSVAAGIIKGCTNNTLCNSFFGCCAGPGPLATGACNTALGYQAGAAISNGNVNTIVGYAAGCAITSGNWNVLIAHNAGDSITSGGCNIAIGGAAGASITTSCENVLVGDLAGTSLTSCQNVGVGTRALCAVSTGAANTALGTYSGIKITSGACNVAIGYGAMGGSSAAITGNNNVAIGTGSLGTITSAAANVIVGAGSGNSITTAGCNVLIGSQNNTGFAFNTILGNSFSGTGNCQVFIGFAGTTATYACFAQGSPAWSFPSDSRRKEEIEDLEGNLALVEKMQPRTFLVKGATKDDEKTPSFGLVAQEVAAAIEGTALEGRGLVTGDEENGYGVTYAALVSVLIGAVKELSAEVKALKEAK